MPNSQNDRKKNGPQKRKGIPPNLKRKPNQPQEDDFNWRTGKIIIGWATIILAVFLIMTLFRGNNNPETEITYTQYQNLIDSNMIKEAVVNKTASTDYDFHGRLKNHTGITTNTGREGKIT